MSQEQFAKNLHISRSHLAGLESGRKTLTERTINDICNEYNINKEWFLTGSGKMSIDPLQNLEIDEDIKEMTRLYLSLDDKTKKIIKNFMIAALEEKGR